MSVYQYRFVNFVVIGVVAELKTFVGISQSYFRRSQNIEGMGAWSKSNCNTVPGILAVFVTDQSTLLTTVNALLRFTARQVAMISPMSCKMSVAS